MDIRYFDPATNDVHTEFVKLSDCPGTARAMTKAFIRMLGEIAPDLILKLVGGSFDGANAMMGAKGGVQKQLKDYSPFAIFVHSGAPLPVYRHLRIPPATLTATA